MNPLLEVKDVCLSYHSLSGETAALSHISFHLMPEEFLAVVGPSGCGKSTLLNSDLRAFTCGKRNHSYEWKATEQGQRPYWLYASKKTTFWNGAASTAMFSLDWKYKVNSQKDNLSYVDEMLKLYELDKFRDSRPSQLSGGMRQRAALIRTLALKPDLLLLDEPFSALDYQTRLNVSDDIGKILKKQRKPAILVTHDISEAISMADRVLILSKRPATVIKIVPIDLDMKDRTPLSSRNAPAFKSYFNLIWKELNQNA